MVLQVPPWYLLPTLDYFIYHLKYYVLRLLTVFKELSFTDHSLIHALDKMRTTVINYRQIIPTPQLLFSFAIVQDLMVFNDI